jgi:peroxiredoxin/tetratricopeptide (TPR) repeat protein
VPWAIAVSTVTVILLMIGVGNHYLLHFQHPYSFEAESEHTIEIVDASIVLNIDSKPDVRSQAGRTLSNGNDNNTGSQTSETLLTSTTGEDFVMNQTNIELCTQNLIAIGKAIEIYQKAHDDFPEWLSDLYPKYLVDSNVLTCPEDKYGGKAGRPWNIDPKMSVSYDYQFYPEYRGKKSEQRRVYGDAMPLVRCRHHANEDLHVLNLSFSYMVYKSSVNWEYTPEDMYGSDEIAITTFEETLEQYPDDIRFFSLYPALVRLYAKTGDESAADAVIEQLKSVMKLEIPSYPTLWNLWNILVMMERYEVLLEIFTAAEQQYPDERFILERLSFIHERLGNTELAEAYGRKFDPRYELLGLPVPDFSATDLNGNPISLQEYRGKVVLLNFWVLWSPPAVSEMPDIKQIYDTYKDERFDIIGVNLDDEEVILQNYVKANDIPWRQIFDQGAGEDSLALQYGIGDIPEMWLIDREGRLITHKARGADLERLVAAAVKD